MNLELQPLFLAGAPLEDDDAGVVLQLVGLVGQHAAEETAQAPAEDAAAVAEESEAPAKKAAARKTAKKATAKKAATKKTAAKKTVAKKVTAKKAATKKSASKKTTVAAEQASNTVTASTDES